MCRPLQGDTKVWGKYAGGSGLRRQIESLLRPILHKFGIFLSFRAGRVRRQKSSRGSAVRRSASDRVLDLQRHGGRAMGGRRDGPDHRCLAGETWS